MPNVMIPEIDADAHLVVSIESLEAFEAAYGEDYVLVVFERLEAMTLSVVKAVAGYAVRGCTVDQVLSAITISEASKRLADALSFALYGHTVEAEMAKRQATAIAAMEKMKAAREAVEAHGGKEKV